MSDESCTRVRIGPSFRVVRQATPVAGTSAPGAGQQTTAVARPPCTGYDDPVGEASADRDAIRAIRDARADLGRAAARGDTQDIEHALFALVRTVVAVGFGPTTACSIAEAALEEGFPKIQRRAAEARAARWSTRARALYDALTPPRSDPSDAVRRR